MTQVTEDGATVTLGEPAPDIHDVKIDLTGSKAEVLVEGVNIADQIFGFNLAAEAGGIPELVLALHPRAATSFEGVARVLVGETPDPGPAAAEFLEAMDPQTLQDAALSRVDLGNGPAATTEAILQTLIGWARGGA